MRSPTPPPRTGRIINRRLAQNQPKAFLLERFFDDYGNDTSDEPVALPNLAPASRAHLHQEADDLNLFHETIATDVMILGSGKNRLGAQMVKELNRQAGFPLEPYTPSFAQQTGEDADEEEDNEDNEDNDEEWDITGKWAISCPGMTGCFGQLRPYTLSIYTTLRRTGRETYGRFDFGAYKGVFRFSTQTKGAGRGTHQVYRDDIDEFLLDKDDLPSAENPTRSYRWRGKGDGDDVIQLGEDQHLYTMTFSDGGRKVNGTWGTYNSDPGPVELSGVKISNHDAYASMGIQKHWDDHNQAAYDKQIEIVGGEDRVVEQDDGYLGHGKRPWSDFVKGYTES